MGICSLVTGLRGCWWTYESSRMPVVETLAPSWRFSHQYRRSTHHYIKRTAQQLVCQLRPFLAHQARLRFMASNYAIDTSYRLFLASRKSQILIDALDSVPQAGLAFGGRLVAAAVRNCTLFRTGARAACLEGVQLSSFG